jgi:hypothetical protein
MCREKDLYVMIKPGNVPIQASCLRVSYAQELMVLGAHRDMTGDTPLWRLVSAPWRWTR